jgi:hypothetical protein
MRCLHSGEFPFAKGLPGYNANLGRRPFIQASPSWRYRRFGLQRIRTVARLCCARWFRAWTLLALHYRIGPQYDFVGTISILESERRQFFANFEYDLFKDTCTVYSRFLFSDNTAHGELAPLLRLFH